MKIYEDLTIYEKEIEKLKIYKRLTPYEKEIIKVTVCFNCHTVACWRGDTCCFSNDVPAIWEVPVIYLERYGVENSDNWESDIWDAWRIII